MNKNSDLVIEVVPNDSSILKKKHKDLEEYQERERAAGDDDVGSEVHSGGHWNTLGCDPPPSWTLKLPGPW